MKRISLICLSLLFIVTGHGSALDEGPDLSQAVVYRDEFGVPHIEAETEEAAWYAMGYEEARDALFSVQVSLKLFTGKAAQYLAFPGKERHMLWNDLMVEVMDVDKSEMNHADLETLLTLEPYHNGFPSQDPSQFFHNLRAYADGLEAYRAYYESLDIEDPMKLWLNQNHMEWVYTDEITLGQVASYGGYGKAVFSFEMLKKVDPTFVKPKFELPVDNGPPPPEPPTGVISGSREGEAWTDFVSGFSSLINVGSNGFCWTRGYTKEVDTEFTGCVADPHWQFKVFAGMGDRFHNAYDHTWFCHLKVMPEEAEDPILDSYGHLVHGSGAFFVSHNQNVAIAGTSATPNTGDCYLLKIKDKDTNPHYYDYSQGSSGAWMPFNIRKVELLFTDSDGTKHKIYKTIWEAGRFGVVVFPNPFWADASKDFKNQILWPVKHPMPPGVGDAVEVVVAYRLPGLSFVDGADHHFRLNVAQYQSMRAKKINDVIDAVNSHDWGFMINLMVADRKGRLFGTVNGTIPQRGLLNDPFDTYAVYQHAGWPVPALNYSHKVHDWIYDVNGKLQYLDIHSNSTQPQKTQPFVRHDPLVSTKMVPQQSYTKLENPGFINFSNDNLHFAWKKWELLNNAVLSSMRNNNTLYHSAVFSFEAHHKNQYLTDYLMPKFINPAGNPPMTMAESKQLALDNREYATSEFPHNSSLAQYPIAVRSLIEIYDRASDGAFDKEYKFWKDLWAVLYNPKNGWSKYYKGDDPVNLKEIWIENKGRVFKYDQSGNAYNLDELPKDCALIDFHPDTFGMNLTQSELDLVGSHIEFLKNWDNVAQADKYRNSADSRAAALLFTFVNSLTYGEHHWVPLVDGEVLVAATKKTPTPVGTHPLEEGGTLPDPPGKVIQEYYRGKGRYLLDIILPIYSLTSESSPRYEERDKKNNMTVMLEPPYEALYHGGNPSMLKDSPDPEDINKLVDYFAKLGGWCDSQNKDPDLAKKAEKWNKVKNNPSDDGFQEDRGGINRDGYPYAGGFARVYLLKKLIGAQEYLANNVNFPGPTLGQILRAKAYDLRNKQRYPINNSLECEGGYIRKVSFDPEKMDEDEGYIGECTAYAGSKNPLVTFFPDNMEAPQSFFWTFPGQDVMNLEPDAPHLTDLVDAFRLNELKPTHFSDYASDDGTTITCTHYYERSY